MFFLCLTITLVFLGMLIASFTWSLIERGKTIVRSGPEIGAEIMAEKMARDTLQNGKVPAFGKTFFRGKGLAVEREAFYSYAEIRRRFREGNIRPVIPALLGIAAMPGFTFFLGLTLLIRLSHNIYGIVFGIILLAFGIYSVYIVIAGLIREK